MENERGGEPAIRSLYSMTKNKAAIVGLSRAMRDLTGNLPFMPSIFTDYEAPIVRTRADGRRELTKARWASLR